MKIILTENFNKLAADWRTHPPIEPVRSIFKSPNDSKEEIKKRMKNRKKKKKKKKLYQLGLEVDDISLKDVDIG